MSLTTVLFAKVTMWTLYTPDVRPWLMCAMITPVVMEAAALGLTLDPSSVTV